MFLKLVREGIEILFCYHLKFNAATLNEFNKIFCIRIYIKYFQIS